MILESVLGHYQLMKLFSLGINWVSEEINYWSKRILKIIWSKIIPNTNVVLEYIIIHVEKLVFAKVIVRNLCVLKTIAYEDAGGTYNFFRIFVVVNEANYLNYIPNESWIIIHEGAVCYVEIGYFFNKYCTFHTRILNVELLTKEKGI